MKNTRWMMLGAFVLAASVTVVGCTKKEEPAPVVEEPAAPAPEAAPAPAPATDAAAPSTGATGAATAPTAQ